MDTQNNAEALDEADITLEAKDKKKRQRRSAAPDVVKVSFNIPAQQFEDLDNLAASRGVTMTEVLRRAIASEMFLQSEADKGRNIIIEDDNGKNRKQLIMSI